MSNDEDPRDILQERIDAVEEYIDQMAGATAEDTVTMVTLSSTLAQLYQAKAQCSIADTLSTVSAILGTDAALELLNQFGLAGDNGDSGDDEDA